MDRVLGAQTGIQEQVEYSIQSRNPGVKRYPNPNLRGANLVIDKKAI